MTEFLHRSCAAGIAGLAALFAGGAGADSITINGLATGACPNPSVSSSGGAITLNCGGGTVQPPAPGAVSCFAISSSVSGTGTTGTATLSTSCSGATGPYTYSWTAGGGASITGGQGTNQITASVPSGSSSFALTVTPASGTAWSGQASVTYSGTTTPPGSGGSGDLTACTAYAGGYKVDLSPGYDPNASYAYYAIWRMSGNGFNAPVTSLKFKVNTGTSVPADATVVTYGQSVSRWVSISTKPCDFTPRNQGSSVIIMGGGSPELGVKWVGNPNISTESVSAGILQLIPGKEYYLNVRTALDSPEQPSCATGDCSMVLRINPNY